VFYPFTCLFCYFIFVLYVTPLLYQPSVLVIKRYCLSLWAMVGSRDSFSGLNLNFKELYSRPQSS
jgi:hypothetical protein